MGTATADLGLTERVVGELRTLPAPAGAAPRIAEAAGHARLPGGKLLRPLLLVHSAAAVGGDIARPRAAHRNHCPADGRPRPVLPGTARPARGRRRGHRSGRGTVGRRPWPVHPRCHGGALEHRQAGGGRPAVRDDRRGMRDVPLLVLVVPPGRPPRRPHRGSRGGDRPGRRNQPRHVRTTRRPRAHGAPLAHEPARPARHDGGPPGPRGHGHGAFGERPLARRPVVEAGGVAPGRAPRRRRVPEAEVAEVRRCGPRRLHRSGRRLLAARRRPLRPEGPRLHRRALPGVHHRQRPGRHGEGGRDRRARHQPLLSLGAGEGTPGAVRRPAGRRSRRSAPRCGP